MIALSCKIYGLKVHSQRKSKFVSGAKYGRTAYLDFDEAHIDINDILIESLSTIIEAKSHLRAISSEIRLETILKEDEIIIKIYQN